MNNGDTGAKKDSRLSGRLRSVRRTLMNSDTVAYKEQTDLTDDPSEPVWPSGKAVRR